MFSIRCSGVLVILISLCLHSTFSNARCGTVTTQQPPCEEAVPETTPCEMVTTPCEVITTPTPAPLLTTPCEMVTTPTPVPLTTTPCEVVTTPTPVPLTTTPCEVVTTPTPAPVTTTPCEEVTTPTPVPLTTTPYEVVTTSTPAPVTTTPCEVVTTLGPITTTQCGIPSPETTPGTPPTDGPGCDAACCGKVDGSMVPVDGVCQQFIICQDQKQLVMSCPNNLHFSISESQCDYPRNAKCPWSYQPPSGPTAGPSGTFCASGGRCVGEEDGTMFAEQCSAEYVVCQCECEIAQKCTAPLMFNMEYGVCDWSMNMNC